MWCGTGWRASTSRISTPCPRQEKRRRKKEGSGVCIHSSASSSREIRIDKYIEVDPTTSPFIKLRIAGNHQMHIVCLSVRLVRGRKRGGRGGGGRGRGGRDRWHPEHQSTTVNLHASKAKKAKNAKKAATHSHPSSRQQHLAYLLLAWFWLFSFYAHTQRTGQEAPVSSPFLPFLRAPAQSTRSPCWVGSRLNRFLSVRRCLLNLSSGEKRAVHGCSEGVGGWVDACCLCLPAFFFVAYQGGPST